MTNTEILFLAERLEALSKEEAIPSTDHPAAMREAIA